MLQKKCEAGFSETEHCDARHIYPLFHILPYLAFNRRYGQGPSKGVQRVPMHPRDSAGPPRTSYSPMWGHHSEFCWDTYEASCSQVRSFEVLWAPTRTNHPSWGPWSKPGPQHNSKSGPFRNYGSPLPDAPVSKKNPSYVYGYGKEIETAVISYRPRHARSTPVRYDSKLTSLSSSLI